MTNEQIFRNILNYASLRDGSFYIKDFLDNFDILLNPDLARLIHNITTVENNFQSSKVLLKIRALHPREHQNHKNDFGLEKKLYNEVCVCWRFHITSHGLEVNTEIRELELATKNASEANRKSNISISIAILAFIASAVGIFLTSIIGGIQIIIDLAKL